MITVVIDKQTLSEELYVWAECVSDTRNVRLYCAIIVSGIKIIQ